MLKIDCLEFFDFSMFEDFMIYIEVEIKLLLVCVVEGNKFSGGFNFVI